MNFDANSSAMLRAIREQVSDMGPHFNEEILQKTRALYQPFLPMAAKKVKVQQDLPYGADKRQRLDLYAPFGAAGLPVLIYVPGGGFVGGDKRGADGFYSNIGYYYAELGYVVLIMNYRLAPAHPWPAGGEDVGQVVAWAMEHATAQGGDPDRIAIFGQSAGASHTLTWLFDPVLNGAKPVSAVILSSGFYRVVGDQIPPNVRAYFGSDRSQYDVRSPFTHVSHTRLPFLLTVSEFDPPFLALPTFELAARLTKENGRSPQVRWLDGHNHVSQVMSIGTPDSEVAGVISDFLARALS